jgi:CelD/BcsL family acetyltransferase involved in cellulose biosynthesis
VHGTVQSRFHVEWRGLAELAKITDAWQELAARSLEPNVFYEPAFALAAAPVFGRDAGAGLVWSRTANPRLLGLFPARIEYRRYGVPVPVLVGWSHPYAPFGVPLVARDQAEAVISAWLEHIIGNPALPKLALLRFIPRYGAFSDAFDRAIEGSKGASALFGTHERAQLSPGMIRSGYLNRGLGSKKRKELRRQYRRLSDSGSLTSDCCSDPIRIEAALVEFLALEASGWKGRAGTAAELHAKLGTFVRQAVCGLARSNQARIDRLILDGRPIAAIVSLRSAETMWCWKIAYDEMHARSSPGVQLLLGFTQALLDDPSIECCDSCATADHPMIDHIWRERLTIGDRLIRIGPSHTWRFAIACALEGSLRGVIKCAKAIRLRPQA